MSRLDPMGLRILAQYERRRTGETYAESLRVDGQGLIPRSDPKYCVQIAIRDDPKDYRFPLPVEFNKQRYFVMKDAALPVKIPYDADATVSILETTRRGESILAQSPLRYRTL